MAAPIMDLAVYDEPWQSDEEGGEDILQRPLLEFADFSHIIYCLSRRLPEIDAIITGREHLIEIRSAIVQLVG
jgi:hypothetical protein